VVPFSFFPNFFFLAPTHIMQSITLSSHRTRYVHGAPFLPSFNDPVSLSHFAER
jgi:hypothetical protein